MNPENLNRFKKMFETQIGTVTFSKEILDESFTIAKDETKDESDLTSVTTEQSMRLRLRNREALYLKKVEEALRRIQTGSFGTCDDCGSDIDMRRMEARPTTTLCIGCKEEEERAESGHIDGRRHKSLGEHYRLKFA